MSALLYALMWKFQWNIPSYPNGYWYFNPFAWQLLFVFGAWCAMGGAQKLSDWINSKTVLILAIAYLAFAFAIAMTWHIPRLAAYVPRQLADIIYPIDKTNLDVLRIAHFLSLAIIVLWIVPREAAWLKSPVAWPAIICGQHSLETFCLGVFLSFAGHFIFTEISDRLPMQIFVSAAGIGLMVGAAWLLSWYKRLERRGPGPRPPAQMPSLAGGTA
jgi:hypothetical protein